MLIHQIDYLGPEPPTVLNRLCDMLRESRFRRPVAVRTKFDLCLVLSDFYLDRWNIKNLPRFIILNHGLIKVLATPTLSRSRQDFSLMWVFNSL